MYTPNCDVFWPGSYPFKEPEPAIRRITKNPAMLLHWPQLPRRSRKERFLEQTYRALFGGRKGKAKAESAASDSEPDKHSPSALTKGTAAGWSAVWRAIARRKENYFKTQITGPVTLTVKLQEKILQGRRGKNKQILLRYMGRWLNHAYWHIDMIRHHGFKPIVVLDEPLLPNYAGTSGSAQGRKVLRLLQSTVRRLKNRGALVGIHCCNRVSPSMLIHTGADLIHFDVYSFPSQFSRSRDQLQKFLADGGIVAWGIVPTTESLTPARRARLEKTLADVLANMEARGLPLKKVLAQSMIAPTCGTGSLTPRDSDEIMNFATELSRELKNRYKL